MLDMLLIFCYAQHEHRTYVYYGLRWYVFGSKDTPACVVLSLVVFMNAGRSPIFNLSGCHFVSPDSDSAGAECLNFRGGNPW